ncbi:hypothetical protein FQA39_LY01855 [Lamprigera yunnana]|nr:hypothetical protein FQA39_LY01855 [Lamprigera yunnana]
MFRSVFVLALLATTFVFAKEKEETTENSLEITKKPAAKPDQYDYHCGPCIHNYPYHDYYNPYVYNPYSYNPYAQHYYTPLAYYDSYNHFHH